VLVRGWVSATILIEGIYVIYIRAISLGIRSCSSWQACQVSPRDNSKGYTRVIISVVGLNQRSIEKALDSRNLITAAGITILILDHILTFNRERTLVWSLRGGYLKWAFLVNRYIVPFVLILFLHSMSGIVVLFGIKLIPTCSDEWN
jgi:Family of unknown function (DUF6533)